MTLFHNSISRDVARELQAQIPLDDFEATYDQARLRLHGGTFYVPDVVVIPTAFMPAHRDETGVETYPEVMPLVVDVWSPSTGDYDVETKLADYQARGDLEIWRIDPRDRSVTTWVRAADGSYAMRHYTRGAIRLAAFPGVEIALARIFRRSQSRGR